MSLILPALLSSTCFAEEVSDINNQTLKSNINDSDIVYARPATGTTWRIKSIKKDNHTSTKNSKWVLQYQGEPARRSGEYDTVEISTSYTHTYSGSFALPVLKSQAQGTLGYSYGVSKSFSASKNSASLKKGEYVKGYYKRNYSVSIINQEEVNFNTNRKPIYKPTGKTQKVNSYRAILPKIKLEYFKSKQKSKMTYDITDKNNLEDYNLSRVEIYEPNDKGIYELSEVNIK